MMCDRKYFDLETAMNEVPTLIKTSSFKTTTRYINRVKTLNCLTLSTVDFEMVKTFHFSPKNYFVV